MPLNRLLLKTALANKTVVRSAFTARKRDYTNPNWVGVGLALGTTVFLWGLLFKQHSDDVREYKASHGLE
ncbi:NADH dehydrogenase [ubiquinone] 1 subunit C1, mitochondrial [Megalops cyprinoides]|uniref:NADH dehydrogenase [ubiquinone] 1 subunit C1, mitochondrial n=1 Tax=Megalops cyprinoides TaxID=118141 RepID=UPI0018641564|nr:NADH dehydrogenase [ubiquinone] 1 subunit C1, mitochondrial [Megalops cyprinoides]